MKRFFAEVTDDDVELIRQGNRAKSTMYNDKSALKSFTSYLQQKGLIVKDLDKAMLNKQLEIFYVSLRKCNGDSYKYQTLQQVRYSLSREIKVSVPGNMDIVNDADFKSSNTIFNNLAKSYKEHGLRSVEHKAEITQLDMEKIMHFLEDLTPVKLQWKTWIYIMVYFCRRGAENLITMKKNTFSIKTSSGLKYISQDIDELTKNSRETNPEKTINGRIYETKTSSCPVNTFQIYLSKLHPQNDNLWQIPCTSFCEDLNTWYQNKNLGHNQLSTFMKKISKACRLDTIYTNHCLRVTTCSTLDNSGFKDKDIMNISGHKSLSSLDVYKRTTEDKRLQMSNCLSSKVFGINLPNFEVASQKQNTNFTALSENCQPSTSGNTESEILATKAFNKTTKTVEKDVIQKLVLLKSSKDANNIEYTNKNLISAANDTFDDIGNDNMDQMLKAATEIENRYYSNCTFGNFINCNVKFVIKPPKK